MGRVLGIGGTLRVGSSSERALRQTLDAAAELGAETEIITARDLDFPMYDPDGGPLGESAERLLAAVRGADGIVIATPGYHGGTSGLLKNALDHLQELAADPAPYLHGKAVGCIVTAAGWQAGVTTLTSLRSTVHALRGWPTPLGVVINSVAPDPHVADRLATLAQQVVQFTKAGLGTAA
jgi:FMN reductase